MQIIQGGAFFGGEGGGWHLGYALQFIIIIIIIIIIITFIIIIIIIIINIIIIVIIIIICCYIFFMLLLSYSRLNFPVWCLLLFHNFILREFYFVFDY